MQSVGVNVSFLVEYDAFTNCVDEIFTVLLRHFCSSLACCKCHLITRDIFEFYSGGGKTLNSKISRAFLILQGVDGKDGEPGPAGDKGDKVRL